MDEFTDYIGTLEGRDRDVIEGLRSRAVALVPDAVEGVSYGMPALRYRDRPLLGVKSAKAHIGLYPFSPEVVSTVAADLAGFELSKGTIRFTAANPLPAEIVDRVVLARRDEIDAALGGPPT